jgi:hypothetical protein
MKRKVLLFGGIAAAVLVAGGLALAQPFHRGHGGHGPWSGPGFAQEEGRGGPGGWGPGMGPGTGGMRGHGMGGHGMGGGGMGPHGMMRGGPGAFADPAAIEGLKTELGITPAQESAWTAYTKALREAATNLRTTHESIDRDAVFKMTPAERHAFMASMQEQRRQQFDAVKSAADALLATLDETQKAKAREVLPGAGAFGPGRRGALAAPAHRH